MFFCWPQRDFAMGSSEHCNQRRHTVVRKKATRNTGPSHRCLKVLTWPFVRLHCVGYTLRYAIYLGQGFKCTISSIAGRNALLDATSLSSVSALAC